MTIITRHIFGLNILYSLEHYSLLEVYWNWFTKICTPVNKKTVLYREDGSVMVLFQEGGSKILQVIAYEKNIFLDIL